MKKLILSTLIILGIVASTQAQTFDFSCEDTSELALDFDISQEPLFTATQSATLGDAGFSQGHQALDGVSYYDVNHYAINILLSGTPTRGTYGSIFIDAEDNGQFVVSTDLGENTRSGDSFSTLAEAMVHANAIVNNEYLAAEEMTLEDSPFALHGGTLYSRSIITAADASPIDAYIQVYNFGFQASTSDIDPVYFSTLQEAMDFISSFIYTAN